MTDKPPPANSLPGAIKYRKPAVEGQSPLERLAMGKRLIQTPKAKDEKAGRASNNSYDKSRDFELRSMPPDARIWSVACRMRPHDRSQGTEFEPAGYLLRWFPKSAPHFVH